MKYVITIINDPNFCGRDAADVPFMNGKAEITDARLAEWFAARPDIYKVEAVKRTKPAKGEQGEQ